MNEKKQGSDTLYALLYDGYTGCEVGGDGFLPDYLPDIRRVLRTETEVHITGKYKNGDRLTLEGTASIDLLYMAEDGCVYCMPGEYPFETSVTVTGLDEDTVLTAHITTDTASCRLSGPRRFTLKNKLKCHVRAVACRQTLPRTPDALSVCRKQETVSACRIRYAETGELRYSHDIQTPDTLLSEVLHTGVVPMVTDTHISDGHVICSGEFCISALCAAVDGAGNRQTVSLRSRLPFSETPASDGMLPRDCVCDPDISVHSVTAAVSEDGHTLCLDFCAQLSVLCAEHTEVSVTTDAFLPISQGPVMDAVLKKENPVSFLPEKTVYTTASSSIDTKYDPADGIRSVCDYTCRITADKGTVDGKRVQFRGDMTVSAIMETSEGRKVPLHASAPFTWETEVPMTEGKGIISSCRCVPVSCTLQLDPASHTLHCGADIAIHACFASLTPVTMVTDIGCKASDRPIPSYPMVLYYPGEGETVWDVAKHYRIPCDVLCETNHLAADTEEIPSSAHVLLIPMAEGKPSA